MKYRDPKRFIGYRAGGRERLERLAELLEELEADDFDMTEWRCCAVGRAALDPWFQAQGLRHDGSGEVLLDGEPLEDAHGFSAVGRFFGTSPSDAVKLFSGRSWPPRVALRIRRLLACLPV